MSTQPSHQSSPTSTDASVTQESLFPKKNQAVVVDAFKQYQIRDYALAFGQIINPQDIRFISKISNNRVCVYVSSKELAKELVDSKKFITIQNQNIRIKPLIPRNKRIVFSYIHPTIPQKIEEKLKDLKIDPKAPKSLK